MFILQIPHSSSKKPKIWKMQTKIFFVNILPQFLTNIKKMYSYFRQKLIKFLVSKNQNLFVALSKKRKIVQCN